MPDDLSDLEEEVYHRLGLEYPRSTDYLVIGAGGVPQSVIAFFWWWRARRKARREKARAEARAKREEARAAAKAKREAARTLAKAQVVQMTWWTKFRRFLGGKP